jgi:hypothetical protein
VIFEVGNPFLAPPRSLHGTEFLFKEPSPPRQEHGNPPRDQHESRQWSRNEPVVPEPRFDDRHAISIPVKDRHREDGLARRVSIFRETSQRDIEGCLQQGRFQVRRTCRVQQLFSWRRYLPYWLEIARC